ncbi:putative LPS assembly protein LptD [Chloroherpeton thalassium]|nr:putative LPS assembly protein LptD [Chloroherpeton thalassium]
MQLFFQGCASSERLTATSAATTALQDTSFSVPDSAQTLSAKLLAISDSAATRKFHELFPDSLQQDSLLQNTADSLKTELGKTKKPKGALDSAIYYTARDSVIYDLTGKMVYLHGEGKIDYQEFKLQAPEIAIDMQKNELHAESAFDSTKFGLAIPVFQDDSGEYEAAKMTYNFKTKRGKITEVYTQIDDGYYKGEHIKRRETGELYVEGGRYTTCNHDPPHYWFYGAKMKIIPGDRVIARPLVLYVEGVPLFALPFMFFPSKSGQTSGIVIPSYGYDSQIGYNISEGGYYWYINDYMDWLNEGDISLKGSWRMRTRFRYAERYHLSGNISAEFQREFDNEEGDPGFEKVDGWNVEITHNQEFDPSAKAKINLKFASQNTTAYSLNTFDATDIISQQATSYASFTKTFAEGQRSLSLSYQRTQELDEKNLSESFSLSLYQGQFYPFKGRRSTGDKIWEKLAFTPSTSMSGSFNTTESSHTANWTATSNMKLSLQHTFSSAFQATFSQSINTTGRIKHTAPYSDVSGVKIAMPLSMQSTLFGNFNVNTSLTLNEYLVDRTVEKIFNEEDSTVTEVETRGLNKFYTYSLTTSVQTRLYGVLGTGILEGLLGLKALRHTLVPNLSYSYSPDFSRGTYGYYKSYIDEDGDEVRYSRFENSLYSPSSGESQTLGISLSNIFEAKVKSMDSTKAIDDPSREESTFQFLSLTASSGYNFAADSLNISQLKLSASTTTLSPYLTLSASATYDFYTYDKETGDKINKLYIKDTGSPLRLISASFNMSSTLKGEKSKSLQGSPQGSLPGAQSPLDSLNRNNQDESSSGLVPTDFNREFGRNTQFGMPWQMTLNMNFTIDESDPLEPAELDAQLSTSFRISPTTNWQLRTYVTYNFSDHKFNFPTIYINRDLHCWQMSFQWTPVGTYRSYYFKIGLKAPQLQDIEVEKRDQPVAIFE